MKCINTVLVIKIILSVFILLPLSGFGQERVKKNHDAAYPEPAPPTDRLSQFPNFPVDDQNHIQYQDVIKIDSVTKEKLYSAAKAWFVETFENARFVIQTDNPQTGLVTGRGSYHELVAANPKAAMSMAKDLTYTFLISIEGKDGRYRYTINNLVVNDVPAEGFIGQITNKRKHKPLDYAVVNHLNNTMLVFETSIKKGMAKTANTDNW